MSDPRGSLGTYGFLLILIGFILLLGVAALIKLF